MSVPHRRSSKGSGPSSWMIVAVAAICAIALGAVVFLVVSRRAAAPPTEQTMERPAPMEVHRPTKAVKIFLPKSVGESVYLSPVEAKVPASEDLPLAALNELIATSEKGGPYRHLMPDGTKVLGVRIEKGVAEVDLSREFVSNFEGGSHQEALTLNAIFHTMSQFPGVRKTQILIEGKPTDTLGGHFEISRPVAADSAWLESSGNH